MTWPRATRRTSWGLAGGASIEREILGGHAASIATLEHYGATLEAVEQHGAARVRRYAILSARFHRPEGRRKRSSQPG